MSTHPGRAAHPALPTPAPTTQDIRPLPAESTASWLTRLAQAHHLPPPYLLDGLNITTTGRPGHTPGGSEIHLDHTAQHHLAAFTRVPHHHLTRALPRLNALPPVPARPGHTGGHATWQRLEAHEAPARSCPTCTLRRTHGTTGRALAYLPDHTRLCPHHHHWAAGPHHSLDTAALPELTRAHASHQRLQRRADTADAWTWATAVTTRWHDHCTHATLTARWQHRRRLLQATNPGVQPVTGSWTLLARDAVTYPETVTLARTLATTGLFPAPRHGRPHPAVRAFLDHTANTLGLPRLTPLPADLLTTWTRHHTR
ncbi:TniQ family protein [Kitasatospora sp. NPDC004615]|uniref:TniQ family protein n=1 Tax=Kitasatospora sp. NPDC004615 TaxID=3364017 RepID=UPI0036784DA3